MREPFHLTLVNSSYFFSPHIFSVPFFLCHHLFLHNKRNYVREVDKTLGINYAAIFLRIRISYKPVTRKRNVRSAFSLPQMMLIEIHEHFGEDETITPSGSLLNEETTTKQFLFLSTCVKSASGFSLLFLSCSTKRQLVSRR